MDEHTDFIAKRSAGYRLPSPIDTATPPLPMILTVEQAAKALRMAPASIRKAIANGELPAMRLGGRDKIITAKLIDRFEEAETRREHRLADRTGLFRGILRPRRAPRDNRS